MAVSSSKWTRLALCTLPSENDDTESGVVALKPKTAVAQKMLDAMRTNPMNTLFMSI